MIARFCSAVLLGLAILCVALSPPSPADGACRGSGVSYSYSYGYASYSYPSYAYTAPVLAYYVPLFTPTYSVTYAPLGFTAEGHAVAPAAAAMMAPAAAPATTCEARLTRLEAALDKMLAKLESGPAAPIPARTVEPGAAPAELLSGLNKCAACHGEAVAKEKGKGRILFKGGTFHNEGFNAPDAFDEIDLDRGRMHKRAKLTDRENLHLSRYFASLPPTEEMKKGPRPESKK